MTTRKKTEREACLAAPGVGVVCPESRPVGVLRVWIIDRIANGEAFPGERVVRLPRGQRLADIMRLRAGRPTPAHQDPRKGGGR